MRRAPLLLALVLLLSRTAYADGGDSYGYFLSSEGKRIDLNDVKSLAPDEDGAWEVTTKDGSTFQVTRKGKWRALDGSDKRDINLPAERITGEQIVRALERELETRIVRRPSRSKRAAARAEDGAPGAAQEDAVRTPPKPKTPQVKQAQLRPKFDDTPTMDELTRDVTELAEQGKIDPAVGRRLEVRDVVQTLARRDKPNAVLLGEPGVGKTAIVEGLARSIVAGTAPEFLAGRRVIELNLGSLVAGSRFRGDFEERVKNLVGELTAHKDDIVLFVDELHMIKDLGASEGGANLGNLLKPVLARGGFPVIGATTLDEYRKNIEKDGALSRRFAPVNVDEPSPRAAHRMLRAKRGAYEKHHKVKISDRALGAAADLSARYISAGFLPDKAFDLVDQAAAQARLRGSKLVTSADIARLVERKTGIKVTRATGAEGAKVLGLAKGIREDVIGQDDAVDSVAGAIIRARAGLKDPKRPLSFLFTGPTGVGKTELSRSLARNLFGSEKSVVRIDGSEYSEKQSISRLIGAPPGYVGYEEAGQLTEPVRRNPNVVVVVDEIEKMHPEVRNALLQVLEDGRLTDGQGRTVKFENTVIIATSNVGARALSDSARGSKKAKIGFAAKRSEEEQDAEDDDAQQAMLEKELEAEFTPEFLNRWDEVIGFKSLKRGDIDQIADLMLGKIEQKLGRNKLKLRLTKGARDALATKGYNPAYGARPLRRVVQKGVEDPLALGIVEGRFPKGSTVDVDYKDGKFTFRADRTVRTQQQQKAAAAKRAGGQAPRR